MTSSMHRKVSKLQGGETCFFEESMNPTKVKEYLNRVKESDKLKGMKSILAMMSKGKDVSDFFSDVVKNVIANSVEVKKMVYTYLVHYADANPSCRELALLSINSFQKDLVAPNQLIRALALRVMTSIRVSDIIQIQVLAVRKCAIDSSPYVRKCAANALPKIFALDPDRGVDLQGILKDLLNDGSTMVLGSAVAAFNEISPVEYSLLHSSYRKLCHLLADVDEWGQIIVLDVLLRYARTQFLDPRPTEIPPRNVGGETQFSQANHNSLKLVHASNSADTTSKRIMRRRVIRRAFYSDEEDESTEEEYEERAPYAVSIEPGISGPQGGNNLSSEIRSSDLQNDLDPDLSMLLDTSLPLLKSRNAGVVLGVCALHYYCSPLGPTRAEQIGKALVRIIRSPREIQYIVLEAIKRMAMENPLMFRPFLREFFIKANDPIFICLAKLDILTALVDEENCETFLRELQICVRSGDKKFACASARAVGKVSHSQPDVAPSCLRGLMVLVRNSNQPAVVGEAVVVVRHMLQWHPELVEESDEVLRMLICMLLGAVAVKEPPPEWSVTLTDPDAQASVVWLVGKRLCSTTISNLAPDILRLLAKSIDDFASPVKLQIMNLAAKLVLHMHPASQPVESLVSYVLEKCSFDSVQDVRDRARFLIALLGMCASVSAEGEEIDSAALIALRARAHSIVLPNVDIPNWHGAKGLYEIVDAKSKSRGRFVIGSLSATLGSRMPGYIDLPPWAKIQPDKIVRDPVLDPALEQGRTGTFYNEKEDESDADDNSSDETETTDGSDSSSGTGSLISSRSSSSGVSSEYTSGSSGSTSGGASESGSYSESDRSSHSYASQSSSSLSPSDSRGGSEPGSEADDLQGDEVEKLLPSMGNIGMDSEGVENLCYGAQNMPDLSSSKNSSFIPTVSPLEGAGSSSSDVGGARIRLDNLAPVHSTPEESHSFWSTLLFPEAANGLSVELAFARNCYNNKKPSGTTLDIIIRLKNMNKVPIRRIRILPPWDGTPLMGWKEVQSLPPGAVKDVRLQIDCGTRGKAVRCELKTVSGSYMMTIEPQQGELLKPYQITAAEFDKLVKKMNHTATCKNIDTVATDKEISKCILSSAHLLQLPTEQDSNLHFSGCGLTDPTTHIALVYISGHTGARVLKVVSDVPSIGLELANALERAVKTNCR